MVQSDLAEKIAEWLDNSAGMLGYCNTLHLSFSSLKLQELYDSRERLIIRNILLAFYIAD